MKFQINSKSLLSALSAVGRVVPAKSPLQILNSFLISVGDREVTITASDTENRASMTIQAETDEQGAFCIEAKFLTNIVKNLPDCPVAIAVSENGDVSISTEKNSFNAVAQDASQYPQSNFNETAEAEFQLPTEAVLSGFAETSFAVGTDDFHPQMTGVCLDVKPEQVVFVATDTRQLVKSVQSVQTGMQASCIIPTKAVSAAVGIISKEPNVFVSVYPTAVEFKGQGFELRCQLIKGNYPPYDRVIPISNPYTAAFSRADLLNAVRRVSACADSTYGTLRFDFDGDRVVISSNDTAFNRSAKETTECDSNGARMTIGLSAGLLQGLLGALPTERVEFKMSDPSRPIVILPVGDDQHLTMLLMPMNVQ